MVITEVDTAEIAHILEERFSIRFERKDRAAFHLLANLASRSGIDALHRAHALLGIEYEDFAQHLMLCETIVADAVENDDGSHSVSLTVSEALVIAEPIVAMSFFAANEVELQLRLSHEQVEDAAKDLMGYIRDGIQRIYELAGPCPSPDEHSFMPSIH